MSTTDQAGSVEQQLTWAEGACAKAGVEAVASFADHGKSGHATAKRKGFHDMLAYCQDAQRRGEPVDVIVTWHANRFSRADSIETSWYLHEFRKAGVGKMLTAERWVSFDRLEDRVLLGLEQDVSSHKYSVDLAHACIRGKLTRAKAGAWCGGRVPLGYRLTFRVGEGRGGRPLPDRL